MLVHFIWTAIKVVVWLISYCSYFCIYRFQITSFFDGDPDLTRPPQFTAYSSESAAGGGASPKPHPTASPTSSVGGNSRRKRSLFSDAEIKSLRYYGFYYPSLIFKVCTCPCTCVYIHVHCIGAYALYMYMYMCRHGKDSDSGEK